MTLLIAALFFGGLALCVLPEIFYDRRSIRYAPRVPPSAARRASLR